MSGARWIVLLGPIFCAIIALAQSTETAVQVPEIRVNASRLADAKAGALVTVLDRVTLDRMGRGSLTEILRDLPELSMTGITDQVSISSTRGAVAADLRGLGGGNTLVLVDGRRVTVSANAFDQTTFVDLNRFPPGALERVEIIKGGASAVHGPDAVAGVINLVTRRTVFGGELGVSYGNAFDTDVAERRVTATLGTGRGPLQVSVSLEYFDRNALMAADRWFSRTALLTPRFAASYDHFSRLPPAQLAGFDGRFLWGPHPLLSVAGAPVNGQNGVDIPGLAHGMPVTALPGAAGTPAMWLTQATSHATTPWLDGTGGRYIDVAAGRFVPAELTRNDPAARNLYDFQSVNGALPAISRAGGLLGARYLLSNRAEFFLTAQGQRQRTRTILTPARLTLTVPRTNFFNPFGVDVAAQWSPLEAGTRRSFNGNDSFGLTGGVRAALRARWRWEVAASFSRDEFTDMFYGAFSAPRTAAALARTDATALNPFGGPSYRHDPRIWEELLEPTWLFGRAELASADARFGGDAFMLPAGPVRAMGYVEARRERLARASDPESREGRMLAAARYGADASWSREVGALAMEIEAPLLARRAKVSAPLLTLHLAARAEAFAAAPDSGVRPAMTLTMQPTAWLRAHASTARTFRAPTLLQLYAPQSITFANSVTDPRRPIALTGDVYDGPNVQRAMRSGGNPDLEPETGLAHQLGIMLAPPGPALAGLTLETTWFRHDLSGVINGPGLTDVVLHELGATAALVTRDPGSESYTNLTGAPVMILSGPAGEMRPVQPGQSVSVPGRLREIATFSYNLARQRVVGTDVAVRWRRELGPRWGLWMFGAAATYFDETSSTSSPSGSLINYIGIPSAPRWRWSATFDRERGPWQTGLAMRFVDSSGDLNTHGQYLKPYRTVALRVAHAFAQDHAWLRGCTLSVHLDDIFDEEPPLAMDPPVGYNYMIVPRPQGRFWRVALKRAW